VCPTRSLDLNAPPYAAARPLLTAPRGRIDTRTHPAFFLLLFISLPASLPGPGPACANYIPPSIRPPSHRILHPPLNASAPGTTAESARKWASGAWVARKLLLRLFERSTVEWDGVRSARMRWTHIHATCAAQRVLFLVLLLRPSFFLRHVVRPAAARARTVSGARVPRSETAGAGCEGALLARTGHHPPLHSAVYVSMSSL
jgi:hypothetical protein